MIRTGRTQLTIQPKISHSHRLQQLLQKLQMMDPHARAALKSPSVSRDADGCGLADRLQMHTGAKDNTRLPGRTSPRPAALPRVRPRTPPRRTMIGALFLIFSGLCEGWRRLDTVPAVIPPTQKPTHKPKKCPPDFAYNSTISPPINKIFG